MSGSTIGGFVGGGIGLLVGGAAGARWGWMIGSTLGGIVDPQKVHGPRLSDAQRQTAQEGVPIPFGFGTFPCMGNIMWADVLVEHEEEEGGKGGPTNVTYTYTRSFAIEFAEAPYPDGISGFQKVLINGKLVYDISPDSEILGDNAKFLEYATLYTGSETQEPDPTMEAVIGAGMVDAHRGMSYIVFTDYDCTDTQGAIPQVEVIVQMCGTYTEGEDYVTALSSFHYPMTEGGTQGVDVLGGNDPIVYVANYTAGADGLSFDIYGGGEELSEDVFNGVVTADWSLFVRHTHDSTSGEDNAGLGWIAGAVTNHIFQDCWWAFYLTGAIGQPRNIPAVVIYNQVGGGYELQAPSAASLGTPYVYGIRKTGTLFEFLINGAPVNSMTLPGSYATPTSTFGSSSLLLIGSGLRSSDDYGSNSTVLHLCGAPRHVTDAEAQMISAHLGVLPEGVYAVPDAPGVFVDADGNLLTDAAGGDELGSCTVTLAEIVTELCTRAGIDPDTELDVSELTDEVGGFVCATESGADGYIEALRLGYFFDRAEWDKKLRFPKRGKATVANLTTDDLVRLDADKPCIQQTQIQEAELLRKVNVLTLDPETEYRQGKQTWERRAGTIQAKGESSIEIPVVCTADEAAQMAEKRGKIGWAEGEKFRFGLPPKWSKLTPTDDVSLTDKRGVSHRIRLQDMNEVAGLITVEEAVKNRQSVYTGAVATGTSNPNTGGGSSSGPVGHTFFAAMNLPQLRPQDGSGLYVGAAGLLPAWRGCQVLLSVDGGVSYVVALTINRATKMGPLTAACTSSSEPVAVKVYGGTLESKTSAQVLLGQNWAAIDSGGTAELFAYEDATATATAPATTDYDLETNTRGLQGTTAAAHAAGDVFMDLATCYFLPVSSDFAGTTLYLKAVGFGVSADAVEPITVVLEARELIIDGGEIT